MTGPDPARGTRPASLRNPQGCPRVEWLARLVDSGAFDSDDAEDERQGWIAGQAQASLRSKAAPKKRTAPSRRARGAA